MRRFGIAAGWLRHLSIAVTQQHHLELAPVFRQHLPQDGVALDVGAHAGQFAKLLARLAPGGVVHALEPSGYARSILEPALKLNRVRNVVVHPFGLSDAQGELVLHTPIKRRGGMGFGKAHLGGEAGAASAVQTVKLTTLDRFSATARLDRLDFIKADIEGWELHMLRGGLETIARHRPAIYLEVDHRLLQRAGSTPAAIWSALQPFGYSARIAPGFDPVDGYKTTGDYLFAAV
jgi:FkbM family methyltransferase